jgi:hypothetical protein
MVCKTNEDKKLLIFFFEKWFKNKLHEDDKRCVVMHLGL